MAQVKKVNQPAPKPRRRATTPEGQEGQLVALAVDLAERQLRDGTASSQVIAQLLKYASPRERLEREKLERENALLRSKVEALESSVRVEELYENAIKAMRGYQGFETEEDEYYD